MVIKPTTCSECGVALCAKAQFVYKGLVGLCFRLFDKLEDMDPCSMNLCAVATSQEAAYVPTLQADSTQINNTKGPVNNEQIKKRKRRVLSLPVMPPTS